MDRPPNVVHQDRASLEPPSHGEPFGFLRRQLGADAGGKKIGASLVELPPGKRSGPFPSHTANEEAIYVLDGEAVLRLPSGEVAVRAGHYIAFPASSEHAHQMINRSAAALRYLVISAMISPATMETARKAEVMVHVGDLPWVTESHGERYEIRLQLLGSEAGGRDLSCMLHEIPPDKRSWPYHFHWANEEAIYVLAGAGTLRLPAGEVAVGAGDYMAFPVGPDYAHQMINTGGQPLRYLCFSTMIVPEIAEYPDLPGKMALFFDCAPGRQQGHRRFGFFKDAGYWDAVEK